MSRNLDDATFIGSTRAQFGLDTWPSAGCIRPPMLWPDSRPRWRWGDAYGQSCSMRWQARPAEDRPARGRDRFPARVRVARPLLPGAPRLDGSDARPHPAAGHDEHRERLRHGDRALDGTLSRTPPGRGGAWL